MDALDDLVEWSIAIDNLLIDVHGFGIADLVGIALRYSDTVLRQIAPSWSDSARPILPWQPDCQASLEQARQIAALPAVIDEVEVARYGEIDADAAFADAIGQCGERGVLAAEWATGDAVPVAAQLLERPGTTVPFLALRDAEHCRHPIPVGAVLSALQVACAALLPETNQPQEIRLRLNGSALQTIASVLTPWGEPAPDDLAEAAEPDAAETTPVTPDSDADRDDHHADEHGHQAETDASIDSDEIRACDLIISVSTNVVAAIVGVCAVEESEAPQLIDAATERLSRVRCRDLAEAGVPIRPDGRIVPLIVMTGPVQVRSVIEQGTPLILSILDLRLMFRTGRFGADRDEAWRFLKSVTAAGDLALTSPTVLDAWRFWCTEGGMTFDDVGSITSAETRTGWAACDETWADYAAWDAIDATLHTFGCPPAREFPLADLEDHLPAAGTLWPPIRGVVYVLAAPNLMVYADVVSELAWATPAPSLPLTLASAIRDRLAELGVPAALSGPVAIVLDFGPLSMDRAAEPTPGDPVSIVTARLDPDWFALLERDPQEAARVCGQRILDDLEPLLEHDGAPLLDAWTACGPLLATSRRVTPLAPRRAVTQSSSLSAECAAWRAIADEQLPSGIYHGSQAAALANEQLHPTGQEQLRQLLARFDHDAALTAALATLDSCLGELAQQREQIDFGLAGPWADMIRENALRVQNDSLAMSRNAQVLVEYLNAAPRAGVAGLPEPDRFDLADLLAAAAVTVETGSAAHHPKPSLDSLAVMITDRGAVRLTTDWPLSVASDANVSSSRVIDMHGFSAAVRAHQHRLHDGQDLEPPPSVGEHPFQSIDWLALPGSYRAVEDGMISELGAGVTAVTAVLADLTSRIPDDDGILRLDRRSAFDDITAWADTVPHDQIDAAVGHLVLPQDSELDWWRMEKRAHRLLTQPLLEHHDALISTPHLLYTTQTLWAGYLAQGRLMWTDISEPLRQTVNQLAKRAGVHFEGLLASRLDQLGWPHRVSICYEELTQLGLYVRGEIDALVADTRRNRIWVLEAKTATIPHSADSLQTEVQRFHKPDGYIDHVLQNSTALQAAPATVAGLLGLPGDDWTIVPIIVTRQICPAAFITEPRVVFTVLDDILEVINIPDLPPPGHAPIGTHRAGPDPR